MGRKRPRGVYSSSRFQKRAEAVTVLEPRSDAGTGGRKMGHAHSLTDELSASRDLEAAIALKERQTKKLKQSTKNRERERFGEEDSENDVLGVKDTERILRAARAQREEVRKEEEEARKRESREQSTRKSIESGGRSHDSESEDDLENEREEEEEEEERELDERFGYLDGEGITEEDEAALALFGDGLPKINLADIVLQKMKEKEAADAARRQAELDPAKAERERKIREVYESVAHILAKYRSGKVPKAFKIIPKLKNWRDIVALTRPEEWSPAAMFYGTRLFASNLKPKEAQYFYHSYLLPRVLADIEEHSKLNFHLYQALRKATLKAEAFNRGILFPMCQTGSTTLRQATIIGSVIAKQSVPMLHSAAALLHISGLRYTGANSLFIRVLLDKKYALPYRVIDALVDHFCRMTDEERKLPVIWHHALLSFVQHYKREIEASQKEKLKRLMKAQYHAQITDVIRTELFSVRSRGEAMDPSPEAQARAIADAA